MVKILIGSGVSLAVGLAIGWSVEHRRAEHQKTEIVQQMVQGTESSDYEHTARAALAIQLIDSDEAEQAVELLSGPVAYYYSIYRDDTAQNERAAKLLAIIEQLARTNQVVAAQIVEVSKYQITRP